MMIVRDPDGYLPSLVANAPEHILVIQTMNQNTLEGIVSDSGDGNFTMSQGTDNSARPLPREYRMVNGMYQPTMTMTSGQWTRWRIVNAGWLRDPLDLTIDSSCDMVLLAKDGIYVSDFPRDVSLIATPTGGRADVMVRCSTAGSFNVNDGFDQTVWTISVEQGDSVDDDFDSWEPDYPDYLTDLRTATIDDGCSCSTAFQTCNSDDGQFCVNNNPFDAQEFIHEVAFNSNVERTLRGLNNHPYHQHVYPFQIHDSIDDDTGMSAEQKAYFKEGDWHDVLMIDNLAARDVPVRYKADVHDGRIMLHCHRLNHEDLGMMAMENVVDGGTCQCNALSTSAAVPNVTPNPTDSPVPPPTATPTANPTGSPTSTPTRAPTNTPTSGPSKIPSSPAPVSSGTAAPVATPNPTDAPVSTPAVSPTSVPTAQPTRVPTSNPTQSPSQNPTTLAPVTTGTSAPVSPTASPVATQTDNIVSCYRLPPRDESGQILSGLPREEYCVTSISTGSALPPFTVSYTLWDGLEEGFDVTSFAAEFLKDLHRAMDITVDIPNANSCSITVDDTTCTSCTVCNAVSRTISADCQNIPNGREINCESVSPFYYPLTGETEAPTRAPTTLSPSASPVTDVPTRSPVAPTPSPVPQSPSPPTSTNAACFSSQATVEVQEKGHDSNGPASNWGLCPCQRK